MDHLCHTPSCSIGVLMPTSMPPSCEHVRKAPIVSQFLHQIIGHKNGMLLRAQSVHNVPWHPLVELYTLHILLHRGIERLPRVVAVNNPIHRPIESAVTFQQVSDLMGLSAACSPNDHHIGRKPYLNIHLGSYG